MLSNLFSTHHFCFLQVLLVLMKLNFYLVSLLHRPAQTCLILHKSHHQQELSRHPQQPAAHHQEEQVQEGPAHGELTCTAFKPQSHV